MGQKKKPRNKAYKPKCEPGQIPVTIRFNGDDGRKLMLIPHLELQKFRDSEANDVSWHTVTCRLNIGLVLARDHFSEPEKKTMVDALNAMCEISDRFKRMQKWGALPAEIEAAHDGLVLTDEMQKATTRREQRDAIKYVYAHGATA